jgi:SAM-dependent methyltransferase
MTKRIHSVLRSSAAVVLILAAAITHAQPAAQPHIPRDVDVPFVVSAPVVTRTMLEMAKVEKTDFVIDLGSGDGRIVFLAAQKYGARGLGVEIDPKLVETAIEDTQKLKLGGLVNFRVQNLFETDLSPATVITMYLLPDINLQLRDKLLQLKPGTRVVSHDWDMGDWQADDMRVIQNPEKSLGLEKTSKVFLWVIPARIAGKWCGQIQQKPETTGKPAEMTTVSLDIEQRYQQLSGRLSISAGANSTVRRIPIRTNQTGNRFVISVGDQDLIADADDSGITLTAEPPRPRQWAGLGNPNPLTGLTSLLQPVLLTEPVRLKRGSDCEDTKAGTKAATTR